MSLYMGRFPTFCNVKFSGAVPPQARGLLSYFKLTHYPYGRQLDFNLI
jgi:hypothetical protein